MNALAPITESNLPALVAAGDDSARTRFVEFFASNIRNPHTRRADARTIAEFLEWCRRRGVKALDEVRPLHGGTLEKAAAMANHSSTRTTQLYDRRSDEVTLDEVERVGI